MGYIRITDIIGPKKQPTEMVLQVKILISTYMELARIAADREVFVDDVAKEALQTFITTIHNRDEMLIREDDLS